MLSLGIVGLPNVGKSTLFKAVTNKQVDIQNYPFTTIEPNVGVVAVPDLRIEALALFSNSAKKIYTTIDFIDIAGLVKGAATGEGLGNKFLANIREVDAIAHVVRAFESKDITHVHDRIDPADDITIIRTELELADLQTKEKRDEKKDKTLPPIELLTDKKVIYVFNISEDQLSAGWQPDDKLKATIGDAPWVAMCNKLELELSEMVPDEKKEFLAELGLPESGLDQLIKVGYKTLGLLTFLTTGEDESRAWTARIGDPIPKAVRAIHTNFERLFIRAEVINWKTLLECGSYANARAKGLLKIAGRDYITQDGDVVEVLVGK